MSTYFYYLVGPAAAALVVSLIGLGGLLSGDHRLLTLTSPVLAGAAALGFVAAAVTGELLPSPWPRNGAARNPSPGGPIPACDGEPSHIHIPRQRRSDES